jgi:hypothetical protein
MQDQPRRTTPRAVDVRAKGSPAGMTDLNEINTVSAVLTGLAAGWYEPGRLI